MESVPIFGRSHSLDLSSKSSGKSFDFGAIDRSRNDSGCFDDYDVSPPGYASHDPVTTYWEEAINQWSERARSVIIQEVVRMNELTKQRKRDLIKHDDRNKVHKAWRHNMRETMDLAMDLMKCVSYDILEEFGCDPAPCEDYRKPEKHLTRIAEEDFSEMQGVSGEADRTGKAIGGNRVFIIRVDHRIKRSKPVLKRRPASGKSPFAAKSTGSRCHKLNKNTMTHLLQELKELRKMVGMRRDTTHPVVYEGQAAWGCRQCLSSKPSSWQDKGTLTSSESVEEIFSDWVRMLQRKDVNLNADINDLFWNISCNEAMARTRRLSEVLDDMPFCDRPDIFQDRCEILESCVRSVKKRRPVKCYWNIFADWRDNMKEPASWSMTHQPKTQKAYWNIFKTWRHVLDENASKRLKRSKRQSCRGYWIIFQDSRHIFETELEVEKRRQPDSKCYWNIFHDWHHMLDQPETHLDQPAEYYWNMSQPWRHLVGEEDQGFGQKKNLENRARRQPRMAYWNIFNDWRRQNLPPEESAVHCDGSEPRRRRHRQRPYWNLFEDWRHNLQDDSESSEAANPRPRRPRSTCPSYWNIFKEWRVVHLDPLEHHPLGLSQWQLLERKKNAQNVTRMSQKSRELSPEAYFADWRHRLDALPSLHGPRRRSVEELEEDDVIILASPYKKIRKDFPAKKKATKSSHMSYKFGRAYMGMRRNMAIALAGMKIKDNFDLWSCDETISALMKSRSEFCQLRLEMRKQRQVNREVNNIIDQEAWMDDWKWNMDEASNISSRPNQIIERPVHRRASEPTPPTPEEIFRDWRRVSIGNHQAAVGSGDTFDEWMKNLKKRVARHRPPLKSGQRSSSGKAEMRQNMASPVKPMSGKGTSGMMVIPATLSTMLISTTAADPGRKRKSLKTKSPQIGKFLSDRKSMHLMVKCQAKQPNMRGRN